MNRKPNTNRKHTAISDGIPSIEVQVANLAAQLEILRSQVRQAQQLASLGTAAAMMAHEVNNLLTPILAYADSALQSDDIAFAKKALTVTARNARMLISMSGRMLELGAAKPQQREKADVRQAVVDGLASMCRDLEKDGITVAMNIEEGLCALADPLQLRQILFNLFLNAQEAMSAGHSGRLVVSAGKSPNLARGAHSNGNDPTAANDLVLIEVRNTGPAIPAEMLPNIFEPFQSSKPAVRNGKVRCSGLGLALVRDLVQENNGTIEVTSNAQSGTTFRICLPGTD